MTTLRNPRVAIYVDRLCRQWVVRDPEGRFWILPSGEDCWEQRKPYTPNDELNLESVPGHYKAILRLPF